MNISTAVQVATHMKTTDYGGKTELFRGISGSTMAVVCARRNSEDLGAMEKSSNKGSL